MKSTPKESTPKETKPKETKPKSETITKVPAKKKNTKKEDKNIYKDNIKIFILSICIFPAGLTLYFNYKDNKQTKEQANVCLKGTLIGIGVVFLIGFIVGVFRIGK